LERDEPVRWSQKAIASVVYLSVVGTCVTFTIYFWLLRYARANRMALIAFVTPPLALLLGWVAAEEVISASTIIGSAIVVGGIALVVVK
jgi:drug/metabolite transporter (DMT)-like permease